MKKPSLLKNKNAGSSYWFIYVLIFGFVLAILLIVFSQVLKVYIYPITQTLTGGDTQQADKYMGFWDMMPWVIVVLLLLFMYVRMTQPETNEQQ